MQALAPGSPGAMGRAQNQMNWGKGESGVLSCGVQTLHKEDHQALPLPSQQNCGTEGSGWRWAVGTDTGLWEQGTGAHRHVARVQLHAVGTSETWVESSFHRPLAT